MIPQLVHPWVPRQMVLRGLHLFAELRWSVPDALCAAKELDAVLFNQLPMAHQPAMDLLFWRALCRLYARNALVTAQLTRIASLVTELASKPSAHYASVFRAAGCYQEPIAKSLPCLKHLDVLRCIS